MNDWVKLPTRWLLNKESLPLRNFAWRGEDKSNYIAALMLYISIAQHAKNSAKQKNHISSIQLSYSQLSLINSLSRAKISSGLNILAKRKMIKINNANKTNSYEIVWHSESGGWAKLPAKRLYDQKQEQITAFTHFKLRNRVELDSLKLYLLLLALRDNNKNHATPSYDTINKYTGIPKANIRSAISLLVNFDMIHVQKYGDIENLDQRNNFYRIIGIDGSKHAGNTSYDKLFEIKIPAPPKPTSGST